MSLPSTNPLTLLCRNYLMGEEGVLAPVVAAVREVREVLLHQSTDLLEESLLQLQSCGSAMEAWRPQRARFRQAAAGCLGLAPQTLTLELVLARLPGQEVPQLEAARQRVRELALELDRLCRSNHTLVQYTLDFFQQYFGQVTGGARGSGAYARTGKKTDIVCGSLIQARG